MLPGPFLDGLQACRCFTFFVLNKGEQFTIELKRRSVQSYVEISLFPLDESGSPSAVNNTFLSFRIRDKKPQNEVRNEESCVCHQSWLRWYCLLLLL